MRPVHAGLARNSSDAAANEYRSGSYPEQCFRTGSFTLGDIDGDRPSQTGRRSGAVASVGSYHRGLEENRKYFLLGVKAWRWLGDVLACMNPQPAGTAWHQLAAETAAGGGRP